MKARVKWVEKRTFVGETGSGHAVVMDGAPEAGGRNLGMRPMEMLLVGLAGCTAFDVVHILEKGREAITSCDIEAAAERAASDPKVFTAIHLTYKLKGRNLKEAAVKRAIDLSAEKYCSVSIMLAKTARITHSWTVEEEG
jgi:putative redox protein